MPKMTDQTKNLFRDAYGIGEQLYKKSRSNNRKDIDDWNQSVYYFIVADSAEYYASFYYNTYYYVPALWLGS